MTGDCNAKMQYSKYWQEIVQKHCVKIEGWPDWIPFQTLSNVTSSRHQLQTLLDGWQQGRIHFRRLSSEDIAREEAEYHVNVTSGKIKAPKVRKPRHDAGRKRVGMDRKRGEKVLLPVQTPEVVGEQWTRDEVETDNVHAFRMPSIEEIISGCRILS